ncbi:hypothetical protein CBL_03265 [Carabus blaptoides fortunei]
MASRADHRQTSADFGWNCDKLDIFSSISGRDDKYNISEMDREKVQQEKERDLQGGRRTPLFVIVLSLSSRLELDYVASCLEEVVDVRESERDLAHLVVTDSQTEHDI